MLVPFYEQIPDIEVHVQKRLRKRTEAMIPQLLGDGEVRCHEGGATDL